jgi:hypothetical protein
MFRVSNEAKAQRPPKKHHFVPQFQLRYFANVENQLSVIHVDAERAYESSVKSTGQRSYGHSIYWPNRAPDHISLERKMSDLEGEADAVVKRLADARGNEIGDSDREVLAWFVALQWTRNRFVIEHLRAQLRQEGPAPTTPEDERYLAKSAGLISTLAPLLDAWARRDDELARPKERWNLIVSTLGQFSWRLVRYRRAALVISDTSVCLSGLAEGETSLLPKAWLNHGAGIGLGTCERVTVPLTPQLGLYLTRSPSPPHLRAEKFNSLTVFNSREFVAFAPAWPTLQPALHASLMRNIKLQRFLRPAFGPV